MNQKIILIFICFALVFSQEQKQQQEELTTEQQQQVGKDQQKSKQKTQEEQDKYKEWVTSFYISCLLSSRRQIDSYGDVKLIEIFQKVKENEQRIKLHDKMLAEHVNLCIQYAKKNKQYPQQLIDQMQNKTYAKEILEVPFKQLDVNKYLQDNYPTNYDEEETAILEFAKQYDDSVEKNSPKKEKEMGIQEVYFGCIVLSRYYIESQDDETIKGIFKEEYDENKKQQFYEKLQIELIDLCSSYAYFNPKEFNEMSKSLFEKTFQVKQLDNVFKNFDITKYSKQEISLQLNLKEEQIKKFIKKFDDTMKKEFGKGGNSFLNSLLYEPKIGGLSFQSISTQTKIIYAVIIFSLLTLGLRYALKNISTDDIKKTQKKVKNEKKKQ